MTGIDRNSRTVPRMIQTVDYSAIIKALRLQLEQIDCAIANLETLNSPDGSAAPKRRGPVSILRCNSASIPFSREARSDPQVAERVFCELAETRA